MRTTIPQRCYRPALCAVLAITALSSRAQSFEVGDFIPPIGTPYYHEVLVGTVPYDTTPGVEETWDYSWLQPMNAYPSGLVAIDPATAPSITSFPAANIVLRKPADQQDPIGIQHFYRHEGDAVYDLGFDITDMGSQVYTDPELRFAALALGDTLEDPFCFYSVVNDGQDTLDFCGTISVSLTSTGTLQLPYGTFPGTRLLTTREVSWWLLFPDFLEVELRQEWYIPGVAQPALRTFLNWQNGEINGENGIMFSETTVESLGITVQQVAASIVLYPDPAVDQITLQRTGTGAEEFELFSSDGRSVLRDRFAAGADRQVIDVSSLVPGIYSVRLNGSDGATTARFVKQ